MKYCPCCTDRLLRHVDKRGIYWFCSQCRQPMPILRKHHIEVRNSELE